MYTMETALQDIRHAVRVLRKNPAFTIVAVLALALGIGANTAIFTVVNHVLLRPLPYPESNLLVQIVRRFPNNTAFAISVPKFIFWKRQNTVLDYVAAYDFAGPGINLSGGDKPEQVHGIHVSADYFRLFGSVPAMGRTFLAEEDVPKGGRVAILSHGLWKRRFGGDPGIVGKSITLGGEATTVVGVMPAGFRTYPPADVWIPLQADPNSTDQGHYLSVAGKLKAGISRQQAEAQMSVVAAQFRKVYPDAMSDREGIGLPAMQEFLVGDARTPLMILTGAVLFVLLIACANVANLLLAHAAGRNREIAMRIALGAGRARLIRQLLTESVLLAAMGGAFGLLLGSWGLKVLLAFSPGDIPRLSEFPTSMLPDSRVLAFTLVVSFLTGIVFGLVPALQLSRPDLNEALKEGTTRSSGGLHRRQIRSVLVAGEIALALVLLIGAGLLIRTFLSLNSVKPGFDPAGVLTMKMSIAGSRYGTTPALENMTTQVVRRIEAIPGVRFAAAAVNLPLELGPDMPAEIEGRPQNAPNASIDAQWRSISPHYFQALGIPLLHGRYFTELDTGTSLYVAIVNETMARRCWTGEEAIGKRFTIGKGLGPSFEEPPRQIVGIVGDVKELGLDQPVQPTMFVPYGQVASGMTELIGKVIPLSWAVRTDMEPFGLSSSIQREILAVDAQLPVAGIRSMAQIVSASTARRSFNMLLLSIFGGVALFLAGLGIYGVMSFSVEQRTHELGIRIALGAGTGAMLRMVVGQGMRLAAIGLALGLAGALGLSRALASLVFGVKITDPLTFAGVAFGLALVALFACYIPARRATRIDPIIALRYE
jgi:predicted permease